jgi:deazaflavin-dependent oxidoreductase (nitroreductase family)
MARKELQKALEATDEIQLTVTGRKSGRPHSNPVWFVHKGDTLYLIPVRGSDSEWYKNVLAKPTIRLATEGTEWTARARPVKDASRVREIVDALRAAHGADEVKKYYSKLDTAVEVALP